MEYFAMEITPKLLILRTAVEGEATPSLGSGEGGIRT